MYLLGLFYSVHILFIDGEINLKNTEFILLDSEKIY